MPPHPPLSVDTLAINPLATRDPMWPYRTQSADEEMPWAFRNRRAEELVSHQLLKKSAES